MEATMKRLVMAVTALGVVLFAGTGIAAPKSIAKQTTLGVPSYPGWTVHRLDDQADSSGATHVYQYQYYSDDSGKQIVRFYEQRVGATASFMEPTHTYSINTPDGAMIQITAPPDRVPETDNDGRPTGRTWTSLITIIRFQAQ
jgi:hypothetical protein